MPLKYISLLVLWILANVIVNAQVNDEVSCDIRCSQECGNNDNVDWASCDDDFDCNCKCSDNILPKAFDGVCDCFSFNSLVDVKGRGVIPMSTVEVGDEVLTENGKYEVIYSFDHRHPTKDTEFLQIHYVGAQAGPIEITKKHMLYLEGNSNPVPAGTVKVGDQVTTLDGPREITDISSVTRKGLFNPLTTGGTIVVNGVVASTYSAFLGEKEWVEIAGQKVMSHQSFFNTIVKPYRFMCTHISLELCKTNNERVLVSDIAFHLQSIFLNRNSHFKTVVLSFLVALVTLMDYILSPFSLVLAVSCVGWKMSTWKRGSYEVKSV